MVPGDSGNAPPDSAPDSDRRSAERVPVDIRVDYRSEDTFLFASIRNISEVGIFVETKNPLPMGTSINLEFELPGGDAVAAVGRVVWVNPYRPDGENLNPGMGVRFVDLSDDARNQVMGMVRKMALIDDDEADSVASEG